MKVTTQSQFEIMVDYMERNGDLCRIPSGTLENIQKWNELADMLNNKQYGETKPLNKWRKAWSDLKNNTRRKLEKLRRQGGQGPELTNVEKRVLRLIGVRRRSDRITPFDSEDNSILFKGDLDNDRRSTSPAQFFCEVDPQTSKNFSTSSNGSPPPEKRKKSNEMENSEEITDKSDNHFLQKFLEFEKEKEKMVHEREMARINQNDQLLSMVGRIVNVLETLAPSIQKYLDKDGKSEG